MHLGELGLLRVGVSPLYAQRLFVPATVALHRQRPAARLRLMLNLNDALVAALRLGDIDLSINALPGVIPSDLQALPLMDDALCLVVREHHPLLSKRRLRLQDLVDAQWILPGPAVAARRSVEGRSGRGRPAAAARDGGSEQHGGRAAEPAGRAERPGVDHERVAAGHGRRARAWRRCRWRTRASPAPSAR